MEKRNMERKYIKNKMNSFRISNDLAVDFQILVNENGLLRLDANITIEFSTSSVTLKAFSYFSEH